ncbi:MAG: hypothetical protein H5T96_03905 [Tissierellales bacterium]|nr:hypothetical protein [Tissierellales bacterium]
MKYCEYCKVYIPEDREICPLCGNKLEIISEDNEQIFPKIPSIFKRNLALKIMGFISVVTIIMSFALYYIFPTRINWPLLVFFGIISVWLDLFFLIRKKTHLPKKIIWQVLIITILSILWDFYTGFRGWSIEFVFPIICILAMLVMYILALVMKLSINDFITYILIDIFFGIIPIIFIVLNLVEIIYPSIISATISIISLSAILIFEGKNILYELKKRMHI